MALNELMLDCFKNVRESRGKRKKAAAREELVADAGTVREEQEKRTDTLCQTRPAAQGAKDGNSSAVVL